MSEDQEQPIATIWQDRFVKREYLPAGELARRFNVLNPRSHPEAQTDAVESSLDTVGWFDEISLSTNGDGPASLVGNPDARMFDGHDRVELVLMRGGESALVPVKWYQLSKEETDFALLVKDQTTGMAELIPDKLAALMERTRAMTVDKPALSGMLDKLRERAGVVNGGNGGSGDAQPQVDKAAQLQELWGTKVGQVWTLGDHRLAVGDCTDKAIVEAVMRGEAASLMVTDPPYNMGSETGLFAQDAPTHYRSTNTLAQAGWDKNFDLSQFLKNSLTVLSTDATVYIFTSHFLIQTIWDWMKEWAKFYSYCVWCKPNPSPSLAKRHWTWATELVAYGVRGKHTFNYPDGTHALNWWDVTMPRHITEHPTEKPLSVTCRPIGVSSKPGDIVADFFLGSGTTLIACQNLGRKARCTELDPSYAAVSIQRFFELTRIEPKLTSG